MNTKEKFHLLIEGIENERELNSYYHLIQRLSLNSQGELLSDLSAQEKNELEISYQESEDPNQLIPQSEVEKQFKHWRKDF